MKTETFCVESLWLVNTNKEYRVIFACPYENQIRLIFQRLIELINASPLLKKKCLGSTKNPYAIRFPNNSMILGFTASTSSGNGAASMRGQRANMIYIDECDYMNDEDIENINMLAAERPDIGIRLSSTPTGKHGYFYQACTDPKLGYSHHHHPSLHNPSWCPEMEAEFRSELTEIGYQHEVLAEFGDQMDSVFNKKDIEYCSNIDNYAYNELERHQLIRLENTGAEPPIMYLPIAGKFKPNLFRTMGVD